MESRSILERMFCFHAIIDEPTVSSDVINLTDGFQKFLLPEQDDVSKESVCRF
jgi:hypothetical protein